MVDIETCVNCGSNNLTLREDSTFCNACSLAFTRLSSSLDYGAAYAGEANLYAEHFSALDRFQRAKNLGSLLLPFERRIIEELQQHDDIMSVVDLGCGTGRFLRAAEDVVTSAMGYEVAKVLVDRLVGHGRTVTSGGIDEFLESNNQPDAISLLEVVEHLPQPGLSLSRVLGEKRPKLLFVVVPNSKVRRRFDSRFARHDVPPNHLSWWTEIALATLLSQCGYKARVERIRESRRSLLGHIYRNRTHRPPASSKEWLGAMLSPPCFWLLGMAERQ